LGLSYLDIPLVALSTKSSVATMSAIFDFSSLLTVLILLICTCTYLRELRPAVFDPPNPENKSIHYKERKGLGGTFWKLSRIGERLSPYMGVACLCMAIKTLLF